MRLFHRQRAMRIRPRFLGIAILSLHLWLGRTVDAWAAEPVAPVTVTEDARMFTLANGILTAQVEKRTGNLVSLRYAGLELIEARNGQDGGYWSAIGRTRADAKSVARVRIDPARNGGTLGEVSCASVNDPANPRVSADVDLRYALPRGGRGLYVYAVIEHKPGYPGFGVGEARYCLKLNPRVFDYLTIDANRRRVMPSGEDWDKGAPTNLKEARLMTTGIHKGTVEHKYDYSALFSETPAYGWSSTRHNVGLWMVNPSLEYLGGGPTKAELTGHLDVNPGGTPVLLNMWSGSHYGGCSLSVAPDESWSKVVGPFVVYCNQTSPQDDADQAQFALWQDALHFARTEMTRWPYDWVDDPRYPESAGRGTVAGQILLRDRFAPGGAMSNLWVGLTAPDYLPPRTGGGRPGSEGFFRRGATNAAADFSARGRNGFPALQDWQRDSKYYQFWVRADAQGHFHIPQVRPGNYWLRAIADGVLGEFVVTNISVNGGQNTKLGPLQWEPVRYGKTLWKIGVPDRTAREFRHGDHYWQWGLYFKYVDEFPNDVNFVIGQSDWRRDWNYVQPPRILRRTGVALVGEEDEVEEAQARRVDPSEGVESSVWSIRFNLAGAPAGRAALRLAFCGTHQGCNVEVLVNGKTVGETGVLPGTSAMQRDGIRAYWVERPVFFDATSLRAGANVIQLKSHARTWSQGVMYDCVRLEVAE
jgi:rhamnogalacturonan endolyase